MIQFTAWRRLRAGVLRFSEIGRPVTTTPTLFAALSVMPDHRTRKGRRFPLAALIMISLAAILSGANDLRAAAAQPEGVRC